MWWWFELVNTTVRNWEYVTGEDYGVIPYTIFASLAFSTVVPALHAAGDVTSRWLGGVCISVNQESSRWFGAEIMLGVTSSSLVFLGPEYFFPLVWLGPFFLFDGVVGLQGGHSFLRDISHGEWRHAGSVALSGLMCGFMWEFWNFWSMPKWVYHIQYLDYLHVFEMPVLGYIGYVPFSWTVYQIMNFRFPRGYSVTRLSRDSIRILGFFRE